MIMISHIPEELKAQLKGKEKELEKAILELLKEYSQRDLWENKTREQYISKSAVVVEIERRRDACLMRQKNLEAIGQETVINEMIASELNRIISFIDKPKVKEVDLDKIINDYFKDWKFDEELDVMVKPNNYSATFDDIKEIAKHFFELGLRVKVIYCN